MCQVSFVRFSGLDRALKRKQINYCISSEYQCLPKRQQQRLTSVSTPALSAAVVDPDAPSQYATPPEAKATISLVTFSNPSALLLAYTMATDSSSACRHPNDPITNREGDVTKTLGKSASRRVGEWGLHTHLEGGGGLTVSRDELHSLERRLGRDTLD